MMLINYVLVVVILFGGYQMSYGENLICKFQDKLYYNWGSYYSCVVSSLENGNNDKVITGYTGVHTGSRKDNDVKMIFISGTNAKYIPANIGKLFSLTSFYFGHSQLIAIKSSDFDHMHDLKHLELGYNKITTVSSCAFSTLPNLIYLSVYQNPIAKLPIGSLSKNVNLKELWILSASININDSSLQLRKNLNEVCKTSVELKAELLETKNKQQNLDEISQLKAELLEAKTREEKAIEKLSECEKNQIEFYKNFVKWNTVTCDSNIREIE